MTERNVENPDRGAVERGRQWTTGLAVTTSLVLLFLAASGLATAGGGKRAALRKTAALDL